MNNEEIKATEEVSEPTEVVVPTYEEPIQNSEPVIEQPTEVKEEPVNFYSAPVNEGYRATRMDTTVSDVPVEDNTSMEQPATFAYDEVTPSYEESVPVETTEYTEPVIEQPTEVKEEVNMDINQEPVYQEQASYTEPQQVPKKKKDIRSILLVILFIFLFAFIMGIPYINDFLDNLKKDAGLSEIERKAKEIEKEQQKQNPKYKETDDGKIVKDTLTTLTCTSTTTALEDYDITVVETFSYNSEGLVLESSKTTTYKFTTQNDKYNSLKASCNENALKYVEKKGYEIACSYNDTEVENQDKFDLSTFTTITDGMTTIEANAKYKEKIETVKKRMATAGYTCE